MLTALLVSLALSLPPGVSRADEARVQRLVAAVEGYVDQDPQDTRTFNRVVTLETTKKCLIVRDRYCSLSVSYRDISFAAAYCGIDYIGNVRRLLIPYYRWRKDYAALATPGRSSIRTDDQGGNELEVAGDLPAFLETLYDHRHSTLLLQLLFSLRFDGGPSEGYDDELESMFEDDPASLVQACIGSSRALTDLAQDLADIDDYDLDETDPRNPTRLYSDLDVAFRRVLKNRSHLVRLEARKLLAATRRDLILLSREPNSE